MLLRSVKTQFTETSDKHIQTYTCTAIRIVFTPSQDAKNAQISSICSFLLSTFFSHSATSYATTPWKKTAGTNQKLWRLVQMIFPFKFWWFFGFQPLNFWGVSSPCSWLGDRILSSHVHQSTLEKLLRYPIMPAPQPRLKNVEDPTHWTIGRFLEGWLELFTV